MLSDKYEPFMLIFVAPLDRLQPYTKTLELSEEVFEGKTLKHMFDEEKWFYNIDTLTAS
jgi:hypothetical protein